MPVGVRLRRTLIGTALPVLSLLLTIGTAGTYEVCVNVMVQTVDGGTSPTLQSTIKYQNNSITRSINSATIQSTQTTTPIAACNGFVQDATFTMLYSVTAANGPNGGGTYNGSIWLKRLK